MSYRYDNDHDARKIANLDRAAAAATLATATDPAALPPRWLHSPSSQVEQGAVLFLPWSNVGTIGQPVADRMVQIFSPTGVPGPGTGIFNHPVVVLSRPKDGSNQVYFCLVSLQTWYHTSIQR